MPAILATRYWVTLTTVDPLGIFSLAFQMPLAQSVLCNSTTSRHKCSFNRKKGVACLQVTRIPNRWNSSLQMQCSRALNKPNKVDTAELKLTRRIKGLLEVKLIVLMAVKSTSSTENRNQSKYNSMDNQMRKCGALTR